MRVDRRRHSRLAAAARRACASCRTSRRCARDLRTGAGLPRPARRRRSDQGHRCPDEERTVSDLLDTVTLGIGAGAGAAVPQAHTGQGNREPPSRRSCSATIWPTHIGAQVGDSVLVTSPQGELTPLGPRAQVPALPRRRHLPLRLLPVRRCNWASSGSSDAQQLFGEPDLISVISFKVDDLYRAPEIGRRDRAGRRQRLHDHQLDGAEPRALPRAQAGADRHLHRDRADRHRGRAQHSHRADHDGDGEDARHRRDDELRRAARRRCGASS